MKLKRICLFICITLLIAISASSCSPKWLGYDKEDLTKYIKVGEYKGVRIALRSAEVTEEDIDAAINAVLEANLYEKSISDRPIKDGDYVRINYTSVIDGIADDNFKGTNYSLQIGQNTFFYPVFLDKKTPELEAAFIGHIVGDTFTYEGTFPDYYKNEFMEDESFYDTKPIVLEITILDIYSIEVPELTDEFVAEISETCVTIEEYREEFRAKLAVQKSDNAEYQKVYDAWAAVMGTAEVIKYPQSEVNAKVAEMKEYYTLLAKQIKEGLTLEGYLKDYRGMTMADFNAESLADAQNAVTEELVMYYIIHEENITVSDEEYKTRLAKYAETYGFESPEAFESEYGGALIEQSMLWDKMIELILDNAVFTESN